VEQTFSHPPDTGEQLDAASPESKIRTVPEWFSRSFSRLTIRSSDRRRLPDDECLVADAFTRDPATDGQENGAPAPPATDTVSGEPASKRPIDEATMRAQRPLGLALSWASITSAFLIDVGLLVLAGQFLGGPQSATWWVVVAVAAVMTVALVLTYRGITVISAVARWLWDWSAPDIWDSAPEPGTTSPTSDSPPEPARALNAGCTAAIDHRRRFGRHVVGVRGYRGQLVAVLAVNGSTGAPDQQHTVASTTLPVAAVAARLRHFDVHLDAIDIVAVRRRRAAEAADDSAPQSAGDRPAGFEQDTWLVLRMDPQHNVGAVAARDSLASTLTAATERLVGDLSSRRCAARPLTAEEFAEVDTAVAAGLQPTSTRTGWRHLKYFDGYATSFWVSPRDITSEKLDRLWLDEADVAVVTVRLEAAADQTRVSAWVRYHSAEPLDKTLCAKLNRLIARQMAAVHASLPAPAQRPPLTVPWRPLGGEEELEIGLYPSAMGAAPEPSMSPAATA
jgi:type VII secretion protein EccE